MATINLPNEGDFPWDLNPAITAINSEVEATTNLVTEGRLSEDHISSEIAGVVNTVAIPSTQKGSANGVAELDGSGDVPYAQLPAALSPDQIALKANAADVYSKSSSDSRYATTAQGLKADLAVLKAPAPTGVAATDTANIQTLLNTANVGEVRLQAGRYVVTGLDINSDVSLIGQGERTTYIDLAPGSNRSVIRFGVNTIRATLSGMKIDAKKASNTAGHTVEFVAGSDASYLASGKLKDLILTGAAQNGVEVGRGRSLGVMDHVWIDSASGLGFNSGTDTYDWDLHDVKIGSCNAGMFVQVTGFKAVSVEVYDMATYNLSIGNPSFHTSWTGCKFDSPGTDSVLINGGVSYRQHIFVGGSAGTARNTSPANTGSLFKITDLTGGLVVVGMALAYYSGGVGTYKYIFEFLGSTASAALTGNSINPFGFGTSIYNKASVVDNSTPQQVWLSTQQLSIANGAPSLATNQGVTSWQMDQTLSEGVSGSVSIPRQWNSFSVTAYWTNPGTGAGDVRWVYYEGWFGPAEPVSLTGISGLINTAPAQNTFTSTTFSSIRPTKTDKTKSLVVGMYRDGANAGDTLPNDASLLGVMLTRVT